MTFLARGRLTTPLVTIVVVHSWQLKFVQKFDGSGIVLLPLIVVISIQCAPSSPSSTQSFLKGHPLKMLLSICFVVAIPVFRAMIFSALPP